MSTQVTKRALSAGLGVGAVALLAQTQRSSAQSTTGFTTFAFSATGTPTNRTLPDRLADVRSVKDFGAVGDGVTDDTAAIQATFNAAFATSGKPHGNANRFLNRPVFFPVGIYKVTSTLTLRSVMGGHIFGGGANSTRIFYAGSVNGVTLTSLIQTNGFAYSRVEGLNLSISGSQTTCFNLDWDNTGDVNLTSCTFSDMLIESATFGMTIGTSGYQGDLNLFENCTFNNCTSYGCRTNNYNALQQTVIGGGADANGTAFYAHAGSFQFISGVGFGANNTMCIEQSSGDSCFISGCRSEGPNFATVAGKVCISGITHQATSNGHFLTVYNSPTTKAIIDACYSTKGDVTGPSPSTLYIRGSEFTRSDYLTSYNGTVAQNI